MHEHAAPPHRQSLHILLCLPTVLNERHKAEKGLAPGPPRGSLLLCPDTDCCLTPTKNALFKRWAFMAGDTKAKGRRSGQSKILSWSGGSKGGQIW